MKTSQHLLISNILMLLIPAISLILPLFSNQIELNSYNAHSLILPEQHNQTISIQNANKMPLITRYIKSHMQFDGIQYFMNDYQYEPNYAFMKGYTTIVKLIQYISQYISTHNNISTNNELLSILILIIINKICFCLATVKLNTLLINILENKKQADYATMLFIYNPACIFFHVLYSESIYTFITFSAIQLIFRKFNEKTSDWHLYKALFLLALSVVFRSTGIFLITMVGFPIIYQLRLKIKQKKHKSLLNLLIKGGFSLIAVSLPFVLYQYIVFKNLCKYPQPNNSIELITQCNKVIPNLYSFIQKKYWDVGFLTYFKASNVIFILIGTPAIVLSLCIFQKIVNLIKLIKEFDRKKIKLLGLYASFAILTTITLLLTNIQSSTRFFISHPVFYLLLLQFQHNQACRLWRFSYYLFGGFLFCIGFPWT